MLFIAEDPLHVVIRNEIPQLVDGRGNLVRPSVRRLYAKFQRGTAPSWARAIGLATFEFRRMPERGVTAEQWLAWYDTAEAQQTFGYTDEERAAIEEKLQRTDGVLMIEQPKLTPPWPAYDKLVSKKGGTTLKEISDKIAAKVAEDGYDPQAVIAYERENRNRKTVLDALWQLAPAALDSFDGEDDDDGEVIDA